MGAGLYGRNGVNHSVSAHIIAICVLPRLLYGLDVIRLTPSDLKNLETYYIKLLKQIQHFPSMTANSATNLLLGKITIAGEIDKKILKTFGNIIRNENSVEREIAIRQLAMKSNTSESWFPRVTEIAQQYDLPSPHDLISNSPEKAAWKKLVNKSVNNYYVSKLLKESYDKSTLNFLNLTDTVIGKVHNIWSTCGTQPFSVTMASMKAKVAVGVLILQNSKSKFSTSPVSPICQICHTEPEDVIHFLTKCRELHQIRAYYLCEMNSYLRERHASKLELINEIFSENYNIAKLIIDCTSYHFLKKEECHRIETIARGLCYKLTQFRAKILSQL